MTPGTMSEPRGSNAARRSNTGINPAVWVDAARARDSDDSCARRSDDSCAQARRSDSIARRVTRGLPDLYRLGPPHGLWPMAYGAP
eukprot:5061091-Prymnesium_polylepis.2